MTTRGKAPPSPTTAPSSPAAAAEAPAWTPRRNAGGARSELTERVVIRGPGFETHGWTLNVSRGGLRAIVEERLNPGIDYEVLIGDQAAPKAATLAWSKDESDGQIVGMKYLEGEESLPPFDDSDE